MCIKGLSECIYLVQLIRLEPYVPLAFIYPQTWRAPSGVARAAALALVEQIKA